MSRTPSRRAAWLPALAVALGAVFAAAPADAQWKWRDKSGIVQYSDRPPPSGTPEADILQRPAPGSENRVAPVAHAASGASAPLLVPKAADAASAPKPTKAEQDAAAKKQADAERAAQIRLDNCSRARAQLKALQEGQRMARISAQGQREFLDDKGRAEETQRTQGVVAANCD